MRVLSVSRHAESDCDPGRWSSLSKALRREQITRDLGIRHSGSSNKNHSQKPPSLRERGWMTKMDRESSGEGIASDMKEKQRGPATRIK